MQINFTEACCAGTLDADFPESGLLSVFGDLPEQPWGSILLVPARGS